MCTALLSLHSRLPYVRMYGRLVHCIAHSPLPYKLINYDHINVYKAPAWSVKSPGLHNTADLRIYHFT